MEPNTRAMFDELMKRFDSFDTKWEQRFKESEDAHHEQIDAMDSRIKSLESYCNAQYNAAAVADNWGG